MTQHYKIVFTGRLLDGTDHNTALNNLQQLFGLSEARAAQLLENPNTVVKSGVEEAEARRYVDRLTQAGLQAEMIAMQRPTSSVTPPVADASPRPRAPASDSDSRLAPVTFNGNGKEYFGIWIVNILLTIVTLGIYSAWAKVRNHQYFYGNTQIEGASFQYLAKPITILKGRLIAVAVLIVYSITSNLFPIGGLILLLALLFAIPWIIIRALRFNALNTAYRNVRFDFSGAYLNALMITLVWPILNVLCLFLLTPMIARKSHQFVVGGSSYGTSPFELEGDYRQYYLFFGKGLLIILGFVLLSALVSFASAIGAYIVAMVGYLAIFGYFKAGIANLMFNNATLDQHRFESRLEPVQLAWIYLTNSLLIVLTLGLFIPWAKVRLAHYRAACTHMVIKGDLNHFVAAESKRTSALGDELGEAFDVGFAPI